METIREALSVLAVLGLLAGALWLMRGRGLASFRTLGREKKSLESIERLSLTPQHSLHLVRVGDRELVVATHPQGCGLLIEHRNGAAG